MLGAPIIRQGSPPRRNPAVGNLAMLGATDNARGHGSGPWIRRSARRAPRSPPPQGNPCSTAGPLPYGPGSLISALEENCLPKDLKL